MPKRPRLKNFHHATVHEMYALPRGTVLVVQDGENRRMSDFALFLSYDDVWEKVTAVDTVFFNENAPAPNVCEYSLKDVWVINDPLLYAESVYQRTPSGIPDLAEEWE